MKIKIEELKDLIRNIKNMDDELSIEQKIDRILETIERHMTEYPEWIDEPGNDRYYAIPLYLHKSQMLLVKEGLEILLHLQREKLEVE